MYKGKIRVECTGAATLPLNKIKPFQDDLKTISIENLRRLKKSIIEYGISTPMQIWVSDDGTAFTLDGHQRLLAYSALKANGWEIPDIPVVYVDAPDEDTAREKLLVTTSSYGEFSAAGVQKYVAKIKNRARVKSAVRLSNVNLDRVMAVLEAKCDENDIPKIDRTQTVVNYGDIWHLGDKHRLMCGDATNQSDVEKLLNGDHVTCAVFDVPYGVSYDGLWRTKIDGCLNRKNGVFDDTRWDWTVAYKYCNADVLYLYHASSLTSEMQRSVEAAGYEVRSRLVWLKTSFTLGRNHYQFNHEPILYCIRKDAPSHWQGSRKETTVFSCSNGNPFAGKVGKEDERTCHVSQKPVFCYTNLFKNSSESGDIVADFFAGSGSGIIAAHQLARRGRFMEVDPYFCGLILERFYNYAGIEPVRDDGMTFSELKKEKGGE